MLVTKELLRCFLVRSTNLQAFRQVAYIALLLAGLCLAAVPARAQVSGQNVNMVSGTNWTNGDPFLQRQNEPSIAVSSRNSSHLLAGANDYRTVDLPGLLGIDERGDAWLGLFKSFDGGRTWQSTLLPGFPLDGSPQGQASPIHGFQAASDPTVRAGTNGLFYYTGLAFNRVGNLPRSAVFVSRFVDLNNKENGDATFESGSMTNLQPRDTIKYIDTTVVDSGGVPGTPGASTFLDKPWLAVDIPRSGATCTISVEEDGKNITQTIPAAPVYVTYTSFVGNGPVQFSNINFRRSLDCGATWSSPTILSKNDEPSGDAEHQGTVIAIDPSVPSSQPATVYVAWRRFASATDPDAPPAIFLAKSADGGAHWGTAFPIVVFPSSCISKPTGVGCPFDQVFTNTSFRSNGYPALTVDSNGRVYIAWSQRDANGDGKIMMGIAPGGRSIQSASIAPVDIGPVVDDDGNTFSNLSGRGSQLMPSLSFEAGKLVLAYYDLRQDHTTGTFVEGPNPNCDPVVTLPCALGAQYLESRTLEGEISPPNPPNNSSVFGLNVVDSAPPLTSRRHTIDVMGAEAVPPPSSSLQPPSFKAFRITNYLFGSIPQLFQDVEQIQFNAPNLPLFVDGTAPFMGDYIDVSGTPQIIPDGKGGWTFNTSPSANPVFHASWTDNRDVVPPADGNWRNYTPPISASNPGGQPSKFDPTQQPLACVVGQTGMRNQNVYTAEISHGVILTSPQTSKPVLTPGGQPIQRAFVVEVRNATNAARSFQVSIPSQPATATASFQQFSSLTTQTVKVNAFSSQSLPVFVVANAGSTLAFPSVLVTATENDGANPPLTGSVLLNPDPTNPALTSPDNAAIGGNQIAINEFYNPGVANPGVANSGVASPGVANPGVANPGVANPGVANPTVVLALNPGVANPGVANPGVANPGVANPGVANESVTDASYAFTNEGNTSAAYTIQFFQSAPFPAGAQFQIILSKVYFTQQAIGCQTQQVGTNVIVANVTNPVFVTNPTQLGNPGVANLGVQTPTINLAPGESGQVTIRTNLSVAQVVSQVLPNVSPVAVSQAVNTVDVQNGIFTPPINLLITSTSVSLPPAEVNLPYSTILTSIGGNTGAHNWTIASGSLPPGLQLNVASGAITGTPTLAGSFPFTAQVMDAGTPQHTATRALTITIVAPVQIATASASLPVGVVGSGYTQTFSANAGIPPYTWSSTGAVPPGLTMSPTGRLSGTPSAGGAFNFTVNATDAIGGVSSAPYTILVTSPVPVGTQLQLVTQPANSVAGQAISPAVGVRVVDSTGAVLPNVLVAMSFGTQACQAAVLSGTLVASTGNTGIATFPNLIIDRGQLGYTLSATAGNVSSVSNPFTVNGFCAAKSQISVPRELHSAVTLLDGTVLVAGGGSRLPGLSSPGLPVASAELYNPSTGAFSTTGSMNVPRWGQTTTLLRDGRVLIAGGVNSSSTAVGSVTSTAEIYDPATHTFTLTNGPMNSARFLHAATLLADGRVLLAGGSTTVPADCIICFGVSTNSAEIFDPATGLFTSTHTPLVIQRQLSTATLMPNGQVLLAGGLTDGPTFTSTSSAEIFDPVSNGFHSTSSMASPSAFPVAALLPNGKVLIAGESGGTAELYDPTSGTFAAAGNLGGASVGEAVLLTDGTVLLPAGNAQEIYNPSTASFTPTGGLIVPNNVLYGVSLLHDGTVLTTGGETLFGTVPELGTITDTEIYYSTAPLAPMAITTPALAGASTGQGYTQILLEQGGVGTLTWTETGSLPAGMSFSNQGVLSGTPTVAGAFPLTFTVTDSSNPAKSASSNFTLAVANTPLVFTSTTVPTAFVGRPYIQALPLAGGTQPYNATVTSGTLPPGLGLSGNGVLNGTPSGTGSFTFTVTVTDSSTPAQNATQTLTIAVNTLVITTTVLPNGIVAVPYSAAINTAGGTFPFSFSAANTTFPPGLMIQQSFPGSSNGALAGTPTQAGTFTFSESVVDSSKPQQQTATQNYVVTIAPVGSAVPANVTFVTEPQNSVGGKPLNGGPIVVRVTDAANNPVPQTSVAMTLMGIFNGSVPCSVATLNGTLIAVTDGTGQATFSNLSIDRGGYNYALLASTGSVSQSSGPFSVQGFCASGNLSTPREGHTQDLLGTSFTKKFALDPAGSYLLANTNPGPGGIPDNPHPPLIITLGQFGVKPGDIISGIPVGDADVCGVGQFCSGELFLPFTCAVFSSSNTLLPPSSGLNRVPGAIAPDFTTAFPCNTGNTAFGNLPTDIPQDFSLSGERVTVPPGAQYLFVALADIFYADNLDQNGDYGVAITLNSSSSVNGKVLIAGGVDNLGNALNTAELYDPALGFTSPTGNLSDPNGRTSHVSVVLPNGKVLLIGGVSNVSTLATAELYDPATGTFTPTGSMSEPRYYAAAVVLADGRVLVSGGFNTPVGSNTAEIYNPATGLFTPTGNMNQGRGRHTMTLLPNGKVLVTGGRDGQQNFFALSSAEIFDPFANQGVGAFTLTGNMNSPRHVHTATLLSNGTVLVAGGFNGGAASASVATAETFDPSTGVFTPTGNMNTPRSRQTSTLLPDGTVLEAGGVDRFQGLNVTLPAELYSPTSRTFSLTGPMITGRELARATLLLPNGNVLASGGDDGVNVLSSTEVYYNPVAQTPVVITTTSVPNGFISQPYVQLLLEQGSSGPITWSLASGTLPPGINLGANGILSGTPTAVGSFIFTVQVTDGINTTTASFTINVSLATLAFTSNTMPAAGAAKPYSQPLPITGGTQPYSATVTSGALPPGLALSSNGVLSGTPSGAGSFTFTAMVTDSSAPAQTATQTLTIAVDTLFITTTALPSGMVGTPYNAAISTSGGTLPLVFSAENAAFPPGLKILQPAANSSSGALAGMPTQEGHYTFAESVTDSSNPAQTATQYYEMDIFATGTTAVPATATFLSQPQNSVGGQILAGSPIRVHVTDANNAPILGASVAISFNGAPPCSSAVLSGTLNAITNGNGNAVFFDLSIDRGQVGYTLLASVGSATAVSQPFTVNGFCPTGNLSTARRYSTSTLLGNGKVLVTGGDPDSVTNGSASSELFDPASRSFAGSGTMTTARAGHKASLLSNGQVLITGGRGAGNTGSTAELYNPIAGVFTPTGSMNAARLEHSSTLLTDGRALIVGGFTGLLGSTAVYSNGIELYDPATGTFSLTGNLNIARAFHTATLLASGKVLIAGGSNSSGPLASVEIYDPVAGTSSLIGNMSTPRHLHTAALLPNGKVLLAGGQGTGLVALSSAELFDPSTGTFTPTGNMLSASVDSRATLLADGTVLISTGFTFPNTIAEIYSPGSGTFSQTGPLVLGHRGNGATLLANGQVLVEGGEDPSSNGTVILNSAEIYYGTAVANASVKLTFFPNTVYNANTAAMDAALGTTGYIIDSFETTALIPGLTIQLSGGVPTTTWTSLPNLFDGDICPGLTSGEGWDGTDTASNQVSNQVTNCASALGSANVITFNYAPGATSFGVGLSNFQSVNPASPSFPITNHELFVNGVDMGVLETLAGAAWSSGLTRNVYLRIDATSGGVITSVGIENLSGVDFLMFDHLAILP